MADKTTCSVVCWGLAGAIMAILVAIFFGGSPTTAETPKRFVVVYKQAGFDQTAWDEIVVLQDTQTGTCWLAMAGYRKGGPVLAPKEVCEVNPGGR